MRSVGYVGSETFEVAVLVGFRLESWCKLVLLLDEVEAEAWPLTPFAFEEASKPMKRERDCWWWWEDTGPMGEEG